MEEGGISLSLGEIRLSVKAQTRSLRKLFALVIVFPGVFRRCSAHFPPPEAERNIHRHDRRLHCQSFASDAAN